MRREHPDASPGEIDSMVRGWLTAPPAQGRLRLPSRGRGMATPVASALRRAAADLDALKVRWALIGGLAISVRSVPRFTRDLDFAVAVADDSEAEDVVHRLRGRGYRPEILEQDYVERLSGVRLARSRASGGPGTAAARVSGKTGRSCR